MKNESFEIFINSVKSPMTRQVYTYSLNEFMKFLKIKEYDDILKFETKEIHKLLTSWIISMTKKQLKSHTITSKLNAIESFLDMNLVVYHKKILHKLIPSSDYIPGGEIPFTNEEIQRMLTYTTKLRTKALIHFLASTGIRPAGLTDPILCLKHLENMPNDCIAVKIYDGSRYNYWAFLTPEASTSLQHYFNSRKLNGETLTENSPIFANYEKANNRSQEHVSSKTVRTLIRNLIKNSGIDRVKKGNRYDKAVLYGFRKRFNTILKINNDVNSNIAEKLMAHKNSLDGHYLKPTKDECFAEFLKAVPVLTISDENRNKLKIGKLEKEKTDIEAMQLEIKDIHAMQKAMADMMINMGKKKSQEILNKNNDVKKYLDLDKESDAIVLKHSDGSTSLY